ncbi:MAG: GldG family protein, partial [Myxococcota bacterium]|nr:GldG family protein [Myxococcota bacterium]
MKRTIIWNNWIQLFLVITIVILANRWSSRHFFRVDMTESGLYSLDLSTRALTWKLDKPLYAKVYFTADLQVPYNNNEAILKDKLEELQAYSQGWMKIESVDPTNKKDLEAEANRFGIEAINYSYKSRNNAELKKVYMGLALVYGNRQEVLPAITRTETLEYDIARALRRLLQEDNNKPVLGISTGHSEPDLLNGGGPIESLRARLQENYELRSIPLGGKEHVPEDVDLLWVVGPQRALGARAQYQLDQFMMRGGALGVFLTNTKPNLRMLRPEPVYHGMEAFLAHYGVQFNRDSVVDRKFNGVMGFPVRQGAVVRQVQINYPLIPKMPHINKDVVSMRGLETVMAPFVSSTEFLSPLPMGVEGKVWASSSTESGRIKNLATIDPKAFSRKALGEETGSWPVLVGLRGTWDSFFAHKEIPAATDDEPQKLSQGAPARLIVGGSADMVANNIAFMLNAADWMVQDEQLINIRSKVVKMPRIDALEPQEENQYKWFNLLAGSAIILLFGLVRLLIRRKTGGI